MKAELEIPPQYAKIIEQLAVKHGVSADEIVESAIRQFLERSSTDAE